MNTGGDAALTHAAPEGWMTRRLPQRLELSVYSGPKLHIIYAPFDKNKKKKKKDIGEKLLISVKKKKIKKESCVFLF